MHMHSLQGVTGVAFSQRRLLGCAQMYLTDLCILLREVIQRAGGKAHPTPDLNGTAILTEEGPGFPPSLPITERSSMPFLWTKLLVPSM